VFGPVGGGSAAIDPEVGLQFLVQPFSLSIGLRVIGGGKGYFIVKESSKLFCKLGCKLGTAVRNNLVVESKTFEHS